MGGGFLLLYPGWVVYFADSRELVNLSGFGLQGARVVLSRFTMDEAIWDWCTPWNLLLLGCAIPDR